MDRASRTNLRFVHAFGTLREVSRGSRVQILPGPLPFEFEPFATISAQARFRRSRAALQWWQATKIEDPNVGCDVQIMEEAEPPNPFGAETRFFLNETYRGSLPRDARNEVFAAWADKTGSKLGRARGYYGVRLRFEGRQHNIGEIPTGVVKGTIDCLWPILGGQPGAPQDWRIRTLQVKKVPSSTADEAVAVQIAPA